MVSSMRFFSFILFSVFFIYAHELYAKDEKRIIVGYIENITIPNIDAKYKAKLDTGAKTSSIHANIIEISKAEEGSDEKGYVLFSLEKEDGELTQIKKDIERMVKIKKKDGGVQERPTIVMTFCIADTLIKEEVNLADREHFKYDVLVGRNMLKKALFIVDVSKKFTTRAQCKSKNN